MVRNARQLIQDLTLSGTEICQVWGKIAKSCEYHKSGNNLSGIQLSLPFYFTSRNFNKCRPLKKIENDHSEVTCITITKPEPRFFSIAHSDRQWKHKTPFYHLDTISDEIISEQHILESIKSLHTHRDQGVPCCPTHRRAKFSSGDDTT